MPHAQPHGRLIVVRGSMFAGKTEKLIAWLREGLAAGQSVVAFKHAIDNRYDPDHLITHRRERFNATRVPDAAAIVRLAAGNARVAIDEGHFFKPELVEAVRDLLKAGTSVMVAGISNDAWGRPFEPMPQLAAIADEVIDCRSPCSVCGKPADYTQRLVPVTTPTMVGGLGEYEPRCAEHFTPLPSP